MLVDNIKEQSQTNPVHTIVLSLILLLTATLLSMIVVILYSTNQANSEARSSSILSTDSILKDKLRQLEASVLDNAYWDDLIKHAYFLPNQKWIDANIGKYLTDTFNISNVIIMDGQDKPILTISNGLIVDTNFYNTNLANLKKLATKAREPSHPLQGISGISSFNDNPILLAASILIPEEGESLPAPAPVLIFGRQLNKDYLSGLSKQFGLNELQFSQTIQTDSSQAFINIDDLNNERIGQLAWSPIKPGDQVLAKIKNPVLVLLAGCALMLLLIISTTRIISKRLTSAQKSVALLSTAINQSQSIVLVFDQKGAIKYANSQAEQFFNLSIQDKDISDLIPVTLNEKFYRILNNYVKKAHLWRGDFEYKSSPNHSLWMHASLAPVIECHVSTHIICVLEDISTFKTAFDDMTHLATHDALTELINRRLFNDLLQQAISSAKRDNESSVLLYIDLDGFKQVNDRLGHKIGDELLINVAKRLKTTIREADIVARIGGDEFALLLKNLSHRSDISIILQKILSSLEKPMMLSNHEVRITASIGAAMIPTDGGDVDTLMSNADFALYESKSTGRATFRFFGDIA